MLTLAAAELTAAAAAAAATVIAELAVAAAAAAVVSAVVADVAPAAAAAAVVSAVVVEVAACDQTHLFSLLSAGGHTQYNTCKILPFVLYLSPSINTQVNNIICIPVQSGNINSFVRADMAAKTAFNTYTSMLRQDSAVRIMAYMCFPYLHVDCELVMFMSSMVYACVLAKTRGSCLLWHNLEAHSAWLITNNYL